MIPTKTYPLSAIMGDQLTDKERIAELEAQVKHCEGHAAELEAENARLREAMDKYSEDNMLCNDTIERCAKVCEELEIEFCEEYKRSGYASYHEGMTDGAGNCVEAIRALKEGK